MEESSKVKLLVSCDALDDLPQISRDRYRGPDFAKTEWETPISIMRLSGDYFEDENPILQAKTEHVRVLTYNGNKYFQIWFDPNKALTWRPDIFTTRLMAGIRKATILIQLEAAFLSAAFGRTIDD